MKTIIVQKYGGVCLETPEKIKSVAKSVAGLAQKGHGVVVVVSAMGKTTDDLVRLGYQVSPSPNRRELDMLLTTGERVSMALMSMALIDLGCRAISFTGSQAGVMTDDSHSNARIVDIRPVRVQEELSRGSVIVLAGFQGVHPDSKEITTLGRGGTDTTAVAMAAHLKAERCEIVKEVDGVCTADPRIVASARPITHISYAALREMCFWGAKVLHYRAASLAEEMSVPLVIRRFGSEMATVVQTENQDMEKSEVLSINSQARIEHLEIKAPSLNRALVIWEEHLSKSQLPRPQLLASAFNDGWTRMMLTGDGELLDSVARSLNGNAVIKPMNKELSSVSLTCRGSVATDLSTRVMLRLEQDGIAVDKLLMTPLTITVCVATAQREAAIRALHSFIED